jgi:hypothetical protein
VGGQQDLPTAAAFAQSLSPASSAILEAGGA